MDLWASDASTMGGFAAGAGGYGTSVCLSTHPRAGGSPLTGQTAQQNRQLRLRATSTTAQLPHPNDAKLVSNFNTTHILCGNRDPKTPIELWAQLAANPAQIGHGNHSAII